MTTEVKTLKGDPEVLKKLGAGSGRRAKRWIARIITLAVLAGIIAGGVIFWRVRAAKESAPHWVTAPVEIADLRETVTATGTLNPLDSVEVGAEVSGRVVKVNVDINDRVKQGQILVELDPGSYQVKIDQSQAQVNNAQASRTTSQATLKEAEAKAARTRELHKKGLVSDQDLETAEAALDRAKAGVASSSAQITVARADLNSAKTTFGKSVIKAPMDGIVLARSVEVGQTVTAGFQTPVLFTLGRDLTQMELKVDVDEADVGKVKDNLPATFLVDAYPRRSFGSKVVRLNNLPKTGTTVITYEALLTVDNSERLLRPGMTATATIVTSEKKGVLTVPNSALRFRPRAAAGASGSGSAGAQRPGGALPIPGLGGGMRMPGGGGGRQRSGGAGPAGSGGPGAGGAPQDKGRGGVYVLRDGKPERIQVETGSSDGKRTEIISGELQPGTEVVIDMAEPPK